MTSNSGRAARPDNGSEQMPVTRSPRPLMRALSWAARAAFGLMSRASTWLAPARAAANARMPEPVPTSATCRPCRSSPAMNSAKYGPVLNTAGWKTVGGATKRNPDAKVSSRGPAPQHEMIGEKMHDAPDHALRQAFRGGLRQGREGGARHGRRAGRIDERHRVLGRYFIPIMPICGTKSSLLRCRGRGNRCSFRNEPPDGQETTIEGWVTWDLKPPHKPRSPAR